ncbi:amino acid permease C-terminal domain-containing protein [Actinoplanes sp. NPDC026623]|uniref:amino acid permease C-terminal domain-containing protein n=1 Tax=Actinoplanes sp. NPDC026623 TaxID=3155610 RepID=UPI0033D4CEC3
MPVIPAPGVIFSIWLITFLTPTTWLRFAVWFIIGMIIYFSYSRHHSKLREGQPEPETRASGRRSACAGRRSGLSIPYGNTEARYPQFSAFR